MNDEIIINRRAKIYLVAIVVFLLALFLTPVEVRMDSSLTYETRWWVIVCILADMWFWNLLRIEVNRESRRKR